MDSGEASGLRGGLPAQRRSAGSGEVFGLKGSLQTQGRPPGSGEVYRLKGGLRAQRRPAGSGEASRLSGGLQAQERSAGAGRAGVLRWYLCKMWKPSLRIRPGKIRHSLLCLLTLFFYLSSSLLPQYKHLEARISHLCIFCNVWE